MNRSPLPLPPRTSWIDTEADLAEVLLKLRQLGELALDTEADSYYVYFVKVCLVQVSCRENSYLIDPLAGIDLLPLGELFSDPGILKVLHAGSNDLALLKHCYGFRFQNVFDTMLSAQVLGLRRPGLASLLKERFGVEQKKAYQTSDWRRRPLSSGQLDYAAQDTKYLLELKDQLETELRQKGRFAEAKEEFDRQLEVDFTQRVFDEEAFLRAKGARDLSPIDLRVLADLFSYRDQIARHRDRSPHLVFNDSLLLELARRRPRTADALAKIQGLSRGQLHYYRKNLLQLISKAVEKGPLVLKKKRKSPRTNMPPLLNSQKALFEDLRHWRKARAESRGVDESRIATTGTLRSIARMIPKSFEELGNVSGLTPFRLSEYGEEILEVVQPYLVP